MKREILFRALSFKGEWVYGFLIQYGNGATQIGVLSCADVMYFVKVKPETVGQFTGLTDKNGTKIFEGDICQTRDKSELLIANNYNEFIYTVIYSEDHSGLNGYLQSELKVIGNIHDNPELS